MKAVNIRQKPQRVLALAKDPNCVRRAWVTSQQVSPCRDGASSVQRPQIPSPSQFSAARRGRPFHWGIFASTLEQMDFFHIYIIE